jgi:hypothetical protein
MFDTELSDVLQIVDHALTVVGSISLIQMVKPSARKAATTKAVLNFGVHQLLTVLDTAKNTGFRFETVATSTAGACLFVSYICTTQAAVHSAGSDQCRANLIWLGRSF